MEALPHLGARAQPRNPPILCKDAHLGRPGDVAEVAHRRGVSLFTLRPHELADRTDLIITSVDHCDVQAVARTAEGFRRAVAAHGEDGVGAQPLARGPLKERLKPAFRPQGNRPIIRGSRRRIGARVALGCGRYPRSRQRSQKSGDRGAPTPHPPPSRFPARANIDPQYSSLTWGSPFAQRLGSGWAVRNFFCMARVAPVQQGLKSREFRVAGGRVRYRVALSAYRTTPVVQGRDSP